MSRGSLRSRLGQLSGRSRAVGMFFATSLAARGVGIACQLLQVPVAMHALGAEAFGLWMTLTSIGTVIAFADFGVAQGAQNKLAEAFAAERHDLAREWWDSALVFFGALGLVLATLMAAIVPLLDFTRLFGLVDPVVQQQAGMAVAVTLVIFSLNFPLGLAQRLANSRQKGWMHNVVLAIGSIGGLVGTIVSTRLQWPLSWVIAAAQVPLLIATAALLLQQLIDLGWMDVRALRCRWATMRELVALGAHFGIQQIQLTLFVAVPQVIISTSLGAAAVTPYNLAQRLFNLFGIVQNAFMQPLWPAYSDAKTKGDYVWIRRGLRLSLGATIGCTLAPMALGAAFAQPILTAWVGSTDALPSTALIWLMFTWNALVFIGQPFGFMLAGLSELKRLTQYAVVSSVLSIVLMLVLVHRHAQEGVVAGMVLGFLPFLIRGNVIEALLMIRRFPRARRAEPHIEATPVAHHSRS